MITIMLNLEYIGYVFVRACGKFVPQVYARPRSVFWVRVCPALSGGALALGVGHRVPHRQGVVDVLRVLAAVLKRFDRSLDERAVFATIMCAKRHCAHEHLSLKLLHLWRCERFDAVAVDRAKHFHFVPSDQVAKRAKNKCDVHDWLLSCEACRIALPYMYDYSPIVRRSQGFSVHCLGGVHNSVSLQ